MRTTQIKHNQIYLLLIRVICVYLRLFFLLSNYRTGKYIRTHVSWRAVPVIG